MASEDLGVGGAYSPFDNDAMPDQDRPALLESNYDYIIDGTVYVVYRDRLWRRRGQTHNPRVIAQADAVAWQGELLTVHPDGKTVDLQHHMAGVELTLDARERTEWCFVTFDEVSTIDWETSQEGQPGDST